MIVFDSLGVLAGLVAHLWSPARRAIAAQVALRHVYPAAAVPVGNTVCGRPGRDDSQTTATAAAPSRSSCSVHTAEIAVAS